MVLSNNRLKGLNNWLEKKVKTLEEELEKSKIEFEKLEKHCKNSSHVCDSLPCENCENLEKKVHYLVRIVDKLSKGKSNFENVLASQNCVFGRAGLGFNPQNKQDNFSKNFSKQTVKQPIVKSKQPIVNSILVFDGMMELLMCFRVGSGVAYLCNPLFAESKA